MGTSCTSGTPRECDPWRQSQDCTDLRNVVLYHAWPEYNKLDLWYDDGEQSRLQAWWRSRLRLLMFVMIMINIGPCMVCWQRMKSCTGQAGSMVVSKEED